LLTVWMPRQRWYGTKGRDPRLTLVADWQLLAPRTRVLLVRDDAVTPAALYQVPVSQREPDAVLPGSLIGPAGDGLVWSDAVTAPDFTD
ncbi:maltokinase N-terminal cap-like domain-containing protein, partial [Staphylococcus aureus]